MKQTKDLSYYLTLNYPIEVVRDEDGSYVASVPELPGCNSFGETPEEAVNAANRAKELWIKGALESGAEIPEPIDEVEYSGKFVVRLPKSLHRKLANAARKQGQSLNQYVMYLLAERHAAQDLATSICDLIYSSPFRHPGPAHGAWRWPEPSFEDFTELFRPTTRARGLRTEAFTPEWEMLASLAFVPQPPKTIEMKMGKVTEGEGQFSQYVFHPETK